MDFPKVCAMETTSEWWHDGSSCKALGKPWRSTELHISNRTIKIDVQNDEMTLEPDTKLVGDDLENMKLVGAKGVDSPRVRRNEEQSAKTENS